MARIEPKPPQRKPSVQVFPKTVAEEAPKPIAAPLQARDQARPGGRVSPSSQRRLQTILSPHGRMRRLAGLNDPLSIAGLLLHIDCMGERKSFLRRLAARGVGHLLALTARFITAVRADWRGIEPVAKQRIYYANHVSNADMPMIWTVLPGHLRRQTRPVAAADYWLKTRLRAFVGPEVFNCVLIDRRPEARTEDPMDKILEALDEGSSLILFPEGNRNMTDDLLLPFRSGLFNIGRQRSHVDLVPTWVANLNEIMPKGEVIPLPLICTVTFGHPIHVEEGEDKDAFLTRAAEALAALAPKDRPDP